MDYLRQILKGVDFIEANLGESIASEDVSAHAGVSHWHFQRMFRALTGETLRVYIRSRRLANARIDLIEGKLGILDVALRAGFESQGGFTRAFTRAFGIPPGKYRSLGDAHLYLQKLPLDEAYIRHLNRGLSLEPKLVEAPARFFVGMQTPFYGVESERNNIADKLPPLWEAFLLRLDEVQGIGGLVCYGIVDQDRDESGRLLYTAAMEVQSKAGDIPEGMALVEVPAATYAIFDHVGPASDLNRTVDYIYSAWLTRSGRRHSYGPDVEVYDERYHPTSQDSVLSYGIPLLPTSL